MQEEGRNAGSVQACHVAKGGILSPVITVHRHPTVPRLKDRQEVQSGESIHEEGELGKAPGTLGKHLGNQNSESKVGQWSRPSNTCRETRGMRRLVSGPLSSRTTQIPRCNGSLMPQS